MKMTGALKKWLVENCDVKTDASDDEFKKAASEALMDGKLSTEKFAELSKDEATEKANEFAKKFDVIADNLTKVVGLLTPNEEEEKIKDGEKKTEESKEKKIKDGEKKTEESKEKKTPSRLAKMVAELGGTPVEVDGKDIDARVKDASESYATTKSALTYPDRTKGGGRHPLAGQRVQVQGVGIDNSSELDKALSGVWSKFQILSITPRIAGSKRRAWEMMTDHEKGLLCHLVENCDWDASTDEHVKTVRGYGGGIKALIDDSTSGGLEAAPIVFDNEVIQAPLLNGELYPLVDEKPLDRGRRIEGVSTGTVTGSWGGVDASAISLFNTASYVAAFDTTVYRWEGAVQVGLDFLSDTPIDFNSHITSQYGQRLLEDLDDVIAVGNGTTQPQGVMNASGTTSVAFGGATSIGAYESLRFSVHKREHTAGVKNTAVFCGTETSYQRAIGLPVGAADNRRLFDTQTGANYDGYSFMQRSYKINESLTNSQIFYAILGRYRMYRRKGFTVRTSTEGDTLMRNNEMLIVVMARYGGQMERGACAGVTTTAPA